MPPRRRAGRAGQSEFRRRGRRLRTTDVLARVSRRAFAFALLVSTSGSQAADWSLDRLMQMLASVESRQVQFNEEKHLAVLDDPLRLSGTLSYRAPDYLRKEITSPREIFEVSGDALNISRGGKSTAITLGDQPVIAAYVQSFRATFAGDRQKLEQHYILRLDGDEQDWSLSLLPRAADISAYIRAITVRGSGQELLAIETLEAGGDRTIMTVGRANDVDEVQLDLVSEPEREAHGEYGE
ncbi:MAG: LolA-related protein [Gammaproteobacteria bacterium]